MDGGGETRLYDEAGAPFAEVAEGRIMVEGRHVADAFRGLIVKDGDILGHLIAPEGGVLRLAASIVRALRGA
jgi:hypothetical protein